MSGQIERWPLPDPKPIAVDDAHRGNHDGAMIVTAADLMQALVEKEKGVIAKVPNLNHMPMLGAMYEGLAKSVVKRGIFEGLDLRVVDGKVRFSDGSLSGQIDVMIVEGEGEQLPHTESWIYPGEKVIAVLEVKKTLYAEDLADAFFHLRAIREKKPEVFDPYVKMITNAWRSIMRTPYPTKEDQKVLPLPDEFIRTTLFLESHRPLRILLGYGGYQSERTLRNGLLDFLGKAVPFGQKQDPPVVGFGVPDFPDLIICGGSCIAKLNGMPLAQPRLSNGFWPVLASHAGNPFRTLLELLWTRLAYRHNLPASIFGEDLEIEVMNHLADARWNEAGNGWEFRTTDLSALELNASPKFAQWEPAILSKAEFVIVNLLCHGKDQRLDNLSLVKFLETEGTNPDALAKSLAAKNLTYVHDGELRLLTDECACVVVPTDDGAEFAAGENLTGRLTRWVGNRMASVRKKPD